MAPLILEGETLGQKHRHFNNLVKAKISNQSWLLESINHTDPDAQNLLKIDVACGRKDVPYILEVMKSNDLLYVTRAIKRSTWLITEDQYAHIINPTYLEQTLFPSMTAKAKTKLLFAIKKNLKDENRVEAFFHFYKDDLEVAKKWLIGCSIATIEEFVYENFKLLKFKLLERLCRKSITILEIICKTHYAFSKKELLKKSKKYLKSNCNKYLDIFDSVRCFKPTFNKYSTQIIMDNCRERVIEHFEKYCLQLHMPTFARNLKSGDIQYFLLEQKKKGLNFWLNYENIRHFLKYIPKPTRLQFIRQLFIEKVKTLDDDLEENDDISGPCFRSGMVKKRKFRKPVVSSENIYRWYRYAPFNTAMTELKKLIRSEPLPAERNAMLTVLIKCAGSNQEKWQKLLEYYQSHHINEPFKFKIQFVNTFLSHIRINQLNGKTWNILNNIFTSMEIYIDSGNKVPFCIDAIIVYKTIHGEDIPKIIENKFTFNTLDQHRNKLDENQQNKIFDYIFNYLMKILQTQKEKQTKNTNIKHTTRTLGTLINILTLFKAFKRNIVNYPFVINHIKHIVEIKRQNDWDIDLTKLYNSVRTWRKHLFEISLVMHPGDEAYLNALKHDPGWLSRNQKEFDMMYSNESISIERTLRKVRIYWPESIAEQWTKYFLIRVEQPKGQKAVKYICILLPCHKILPLIEKYAPVEKKIIWNDRNELKHFLRKNIGKYMHLVRPSINLDTLLLYAKGDYIRHTLPSLNAFLFNMSSYSASENILKLIEAPVSLQKHGIRAIFKKLKYNYIKGIISNLLHNNKNSSIKTILFQQTFILLCKEKNYSTMKDIWLLFEICIDNLTKQENDKIYNIFTKFNDIHITIRPLFFMKGYSYLKSLPPKASCDNIIKNLFDDAHTLIDLLEPTFVENVLLNSLENEFFIKDINIQSHFQILISYILSCKSEETQIMKYEKLLLPILQKAFKSWNLRHKGKYYIKIRSIDLLEKITTETTTLTASKQNIIPVKLFRAIQDLLNNSLSVEENYDMIMNWRLATLFIEAVDTFVQSNPQIYTKNETQIEDTTHQRDDNNIWENICLNVSAPFGEACKNYLKEDTYLNQYSALYTCVKAVLMNLFHNLKFGEEHKIIFLKPMLADKELTTIYCIAIKCIRCLYEEKPLVKEILAKLYAHTSPEVNILIRFYDTSHYYWDS